MMRYVRIITFGLMFNLFCGNCRAAQLLKEWVRTFAADAGRTNQPARIVIGPDQNIVVAGTAQAADQDENYHIIKYKPNGDVVWQASYGSTNKGRDCARGVAIDPNGNVIVTGTSSTVKFNAAGVRVWDRPLSGRAVVANSTFVYVTGLSDTDIVTAQLQNNDTDGKENWRRSYNGEVGGDDIGQVVALDTTGNVYVAGQVSFGCLPLCDTRFAVVSYGPAGTQRVIAIAPKSSSARWVEARSLLISQNQGFAVYGTYEFVTPYLAKFSASGDLEFGYNHFKLFGQIGSKMIQDRFNGDYVIAGRGSGEGRPAGSGQTQAFVGTIADDQSYRTIWEYWGLEIGSNIATDIVQDSSGNFFVIGISPNGNQTRSMFTAKLNRNGEQLSIDRYPPAVVYNALFPTQLALAAVDDKDNVYVIGRAVTSSGGSEWVTIKYPAAPKIEKKTSGAMRIEFHTSPGQQYALEATTNFFDWQSLITNTADANGVVQFDDTAAATIPYRFYRGRTTP